MILEQISGWCAGRYRGGDTLFLQLFLNTGKKGILFKARKRIQFLGHMSVFFLDCTKSVEVRIIKINLLILWSYFLNIRPKFSQKGQKHRPNTVNYFQDYRRKGYSKIKRFAFCLIIGSYLKFLSSKIIYTSLMPVIS